ncbi:MAG: ABC transporter permease [Actinomycetota bacterium]|nr:ABC transporter permease [Actinomycetota bacterium]
MTAVIERLPATRPAQTVGFDNLLRSEWTKLRSVRSTYWTAGVATLASVLLAIVLCLQWAHQITIGKDTVQGFDSTMNSLSGFFVVQVALGALGVMVISSEYGTGMIRATFGAVPQRRTLIAAKGLVFAGCTLVLGEVLSFTSFGIGQAILHSAHAGVSLGDPGVLRAVFGAGLYVTAVGLLGFGLGALIRHTAGALSAFFGLMFASTAVVDLLPTSWRNDVIKFMPINAGSQILSTSAHRDQALAPWPGFLVLCAYAAVAIVAALLLVNRRDA